ncbi:hypothetical protein CYMTET_33979 [Cymbomonas tetramitiformis]|uniref:Uncharacterized protein n=1 Tax=Cymbomonas tetramitiformis TaxID=36881 RepID=A0AAE0FC16_9CHLO|nr:hypothetical protein CYMTET_33979 [Cymbomonas tetramitiformis]
MCGDWVAYENDVECARGIAQPFQQRMLLSWMAHSIATQARELNSIKSAISRPNRLHRKARVTNEMKKMVARVASTQWRIGERQHEQVALLHLLQKKMKHDAQCSERSAPALRPTLARSNPPKFEAGAVEADAPGKATGQAGAVGADAPGTASGRAAAMEADALCAATGQAGAMEASLLNDYDSTVAGDETDASDASNSDMIYMESSDNTYSTPSSFDNERAQRSDEEEGEATFAFVKTPDRLLKQV